VSASLCRECRLRWRAIFGMYQVRECLSLLPFCRCCSLLRNRYVLWVQIVIKRAREDDPYVSFQNRVRTLLNETCSKVRSLWLHRECLQWLMKNPPLTVNTVYRIIAICDNTIVEWATVSSSELRAITTFLYRCSVLRR